MSTYPGEDPQRPNNQHQEPEQGPTGDESTGDETQPVGYWERQAAEQAREQRQQGDPYAAGGPVFNPTSAQPSPGHGSPGQPPYQPPAGQPPYGQPPYGQPPYGQPPYGQPPYGQPTQGQPPYGQVPYSQPAYGPGQGYGYPPPPAGQPGYPPYAAFHAPGQQQSQATLSMVLGIIGLVGAVLLCGVGLLVSPFAWALGHNALKEIRASGGRLAGESQARTGQVTGIIGTVLLVLAVLGIVVLAIVLAAGGTTSGSSI
jgi:hypothetical protein